MPFARLELLGIADPLLFRNALRTTLVKRTGDVKPFEELFDYFFLGIGQALDALDRKIMDELGLTPEQFQEMLEQIQKLLKEMEGDLSELTKALLQNNRGELERLLRQAMEQEMQNGTPESLRHTPYTRMMSRSSSTGCKARSNASRACCRCSARPAKICKTSCAIWMSVCAI